MELLDEFDVRGMANITGGGLRNLLRLKKGTGFEIDDPIKPQAVFKVLQELGNVSDEEMYQTFNMGMGFSMVVPGKEADEFAKAAGAKVVGRAVKKEGIRVPELGLDYTRY
jgi:phosphoribosylformylglycinamidine cyclo-ligase